MDTILQTIKEAISTVNLSYIDIVIFVILLGFVILGAKKGLIKTLCSIAALFIAMVGASWVSQTFADMVTKIVQPKITEKIYEKVLQGNTAGIEGFEDISKELLERMGETGKEMIASAMSGMLQTLVTGILFFISFILLYLIVSLLLKPLNLADKLPVIGSLNDIGGGILGLIRGAILLYFVLWVGTIFGWISNETIQNSAILRYCTEHSLIELFLKIFQ